MKKPSRFEQAYIDLYNDVICTQEEFAKAAGIADVDAAWKQLCEYRLQVLRGEIQDPRDTYNKWR